jgi:hypothetical protein
MTTATATPSHYIVTSRRPIAEFDSAQEASKFADTMRADAEGCVVYVRTVIAQFADALDAKRLGANLRCNVLAVFVDGSTTRVA